MPGPYFIMAGPKLLKNKSVPMNYFSTQTGYFALFNKFCILIDFLIQAYKE